MINKTSLKDVFNSNLGDNDLSKLLSSTDINELTSMHHIDDIDINLITPNPYQPRKTFDTEKLQELAQSIIEYGLITPILVNKTNTGYFLIAGERRWRASKIANIPTIKAVVCNLSEKAIEELALLENIQREDLNTIEEAKAYMSLMNKYNYTQDTLAKRIGKSREYVANLLRLLKLPEKIQEEIIEDNISAGHARALLSLKEKNKMVEMVDIIKKEKLNVRDTEKLVKNKESYQKSELEEILDCKVVLTKNKITFAFHNNDDLLNFINNIKKTSS